MRLQDLNWMDVERYLERDNRIILITGATEQHAYLSLLTDILIPSRIALAVAEREQVIVAPPLNFGVSQVFSEFPGTISLSQHTFNAALTEIVESLWHQGFKRFLILNGHTPNTLPPRLAEWQLDNIARVVWCNWTQGEAVQRIEAQYGLTIDHANWGENFPFTRVADSPSDTKPAVNLEYLEERQSMRDIIGDGSYGGPYQVDDAVMHTLFGAVVDEVSALVRAL